MLINLGKIPKIQLTLSRNLVIAFPIMFLIVMSISSAAAAIQQANAQNSTNIMSGTAANASGYSNNSKISVTTGANKTIITTSGNNTTIVAKSPPAAVAGGKNTTPPAATTAAPTSTTSNTPQYNRTGFTNLYVLIINGKTFPIKYSIIGGKIVGMLADKDRTSLVMVLNPGGNGGKLVIELPRNIIDSKGAANADTKYQLKIDGKGVDYKEAANNLIARILSIDFSKDNRFMEIIGTQMAS